MPLMLLQSSKNLNNKMRLFFEILVFILIRKSRIILYKILSNQKIEGNVRLIQAAQIIGPGKIVVGKNVQIGFFPSPLFFSTYAYLESRSANAIISIGENTQINNGFIAIAEKSSISIGCNCLIGTSVEIYDSDFHALSFLDRAEGKSHLAKEVRIGDNVFIGSNVKILKGVIIGDGAVIANGAIVTRDIPSSSVAAGIPAIVVGEIQNYAQQ